MRLSQALQNAGVVQWRNMAKYYDLQHIQFSSNKLYQSLISYFYNSEKVLESINLLPKEQKMLLFAISITQNSNIYFDYRHWRSYVNYYYSSNIDIVLELQNRGLIFLDNDKGFFIVEEVQSAILNIVTNRITDYSVNHEVDEFWFSGGEIAVKEILRFLHLVDRDLIKLTGKEKLYKSSIDKINEIIEIDSHDTCFKHSNKIDFIYRYCLYNNIIDKNSTIILSETGKEWSLKSGVDIWKEIVSYLLQGYSQNSAARVATCFLVSIINIQSDNIISFRGLRELYNEFGGIMPLTTEDTDWFMFTVEQLKYVGLIKTSVSHNLLKPNNSLLSSFFETSERLMFTETGFFIQANMEVLVSLHSRVDIHWRVASLCEDKGGREMFRYQISKQSIYNALLKGWDEKDIISFFETYSSNGIPSNIKQALNDWGSSFGGVYLLDACLLCCKNHNVSEQLLLSPDLKSYIIGRVSDNVLLVKKDTYQKLITAIKNLGYMPYGKVFNIGDAPYNILKES